MGDLRFILEDPCAAGLRQKRTRSRPATACDTCRARKIKCHQLTPRAQCEACKVSKSDCHFRNHVKGVDSQGNTPQLSNATLPHSEPSVSTPKLSELPPGPTKLTNCIGNPSTRGGVGVPMKAKKYASRRGKFSPKTYGYSATRQSPLGPMKVLPRAAFELSPEGDWRYSAFFETLRPNFPSFNYMQYGADLFFDNIGPQFPFLRRQQIIRSASYQTLPAALANCIVGLGLRFSSSEQSAISGYQLCEPFIDMARDLIKPVTCQPSFETLHALILLAWCEYGRGHEAGLSLCTKYAVQMALDVGLGEAANIEMVSTEQIRADLRSTWWSVATMDIVSSWVTGNQLFLNLHEHDAASHFLSHTHILPFLRLHDLLGLRDRLLIVFNSSYHKPNSFDYEPELKCIQAQLADMNSAIPPDLEFNPVNLRHAMEENRQTIFILLHLVLQSLTMMINCPSLFRYVSIQTVRGVDVATVAAQSITEILTLGESLDCRAITSNPFLDYPLALASRMFIMESDLRSESSGVEFPLELAMDNLHECIAFLTKHARLWGNVKAAETVVENKSLWLPLQLCPSEKHSFQGLNSTDLDTQICMQRIHDNLSELALTLTGGDLLQRTPPYLFQPISPTVSRF